MRIPSIPAAWMATPIPVPDPHLKDMAAQKGQGAVPQGGGADVSAEAKDGSWVPLTNMIMLDVHQPSQVTLSGTYR